MAPISPHRSTHNCQSDGMALMSTMSLPMVFATASPRTTNLPVEYFLAEDSLFAWTNDGRPIPPEHGGPVRLVVPQLYAWKSAKWVKGVRFLAEDRAGFWEEGGYHMRGNPWNGRDGERFRWQGEE